MSSLQERSQAACVLARTWWGGWADECGENAPSPEEAAKLLAGTRWDCGEYGRIKAKDFLALTQQERNRIPCLGRGKLKAKLMR